MLKNISRLEAIVADKVGHFYCDHDTPLNSVKEMLFQFQKYVGQIEDEVRARELAQLPVKDEEPPCPTPAE